MQTASTLSIEECPLNCNSYVGTAVDAEHVRGILAMNK